MKQSSVPRLGATESVINCLVLLHLKSKSSVISPYTLPTTPPTTTPQLLGLTLCTQCLCCINAFHKAVLLLSNRLYFIIPFGVHELCKCGFGLVLCFINQALRNILFWNDRLGLIITTTVELFRIVA